jgi:hypothetical protein
MKGHQRLNKEARLPHAHGGHDEKCRTQPSRPRLRWILRIFGRYVTLSLSDWGFHIMWKNELSYWSLISDNDFYFFLLSIFCFQPMCRVRSEAPNSGPMNMEQWWNYIFTGETEELGENLPSDTLSTTNPTWIDPGANPGLRGERPATNRLSHGTALLHTNFD